MKIYFAHPMSEYGTQLERDALAQIEKTFDSVPGFPIKIINPNTPEIATAVKILYPLIGMEMFDAIARSVEVVVAMPFPDGKYGAGVYSEIAAANRVGRGIYRIDPETLIVSAMDFMEVEGLSVKETRRRIKAAKESQ